MLKSYRLLTLFGRNNFMDIGQDIVLPAGDFPFLILANVDYTYGFGTGILHTPQRESIDKQLESVFE